MLAFYVDYYSGLFSNCCLLHNCMKARVGIWVEGQAKSTYKW